MLLVHILGAVLTFGLGLFSRKLLRAGMFAQIVTGTLLAISEATSLSGYCAKLGLYLALWLILEGVWAIRISRQASQALSE